MKSWNKIKSWFAPTPSTLYQRGIQHPPLRKAETFISDYETGEPLNFATERRDDGFVTVHIPAGRYKVKIVGLSPHTGEIQAFNSEIEEY